MLRRRSIPFLLLAACVLSAVLLWRLLHPADVIILPFTYSATQGSLRFRTEIAGQPRSLEFDSVLTRTVLSSHLYQGLSRAESGIDQLSPSADFALGRYHTTVFFDEIADANLHPHTNGVMGIDLFTPSPGFEGRNRRLGARLTIDFKTDRMKLEDGPKLAPLHPPPGTVQAPLLRDGDGPYYVLLPLNDGASYRFTLGIGARHVLLPLGSVQFVSRDGSAYVPASGMVPITVGFGGQDLTVEAAALPYGQTTGVLGMSLLTNYRVVIDFRNSRLYLEPANSRADF